MKIVLAGVAVVMLAQAQKCSLPAPSPSPEASASPSAEPSLEPSVAPSTFPSATPLPPTTTTTTTTLPPSPPAEAGLVPCPGYPQYQCPMENTCPASWDHAATRVGIGDKPSTSPQGNRMRYQVFLSSKDQPPFCGYRGNQGECEQWMECARQQDRKGFPPIVWYAAYPDTGCDINSVNVQNCQIEHPSRECEPAEKAEDVAAGQCSGNCNSCRRPNGFALVDIVGAGGGPPGKRTFAALPSAYVRGIRSGPLDHKQWIRTKRGTFVRKVPPPTRGGAISIRATAPSLRTWNCDLGGCTLVP